jgi:hypothetical protein
LYDGAGLVPTLLVADGHSWLLWTLYSDGEEAVLAMEEEEEEAADPGRLGGADGARYSGLLMMLLLLP